MKHIDSDNEVSLEFILSWVLKSNHSNLVENLKENHRLTADMMARLILTLSSKLTDDELSYILFGEEGKIER